MIYEKLYKRSKECSALFKETRDFKYAMEDDCIAHFYECEGYKTYESIRDFAKNHNFKRVFDIGCAYGHQSEVFLNSGVDYVGIEVADCDYWNKDKFKYITAKYPIEIKADEDDLAVSVLCLTWNCYLYEKEKTLTEQCEALQRDFKNCLLYMPKYMIDFVSKYYKNHEIVGENLVYFSN